MHIDKTCSYKSFDSLNDLFIGHLCQFFSNDSIPFLKNNFYCKLYVHVLQVTLRCSFPNLGCERVPVYVDISIG